MDVLRIYDKAFAETGVCTAHMGLRYTEEFMGAGELRLLLPIDSPSAELFVPDGYVTVPDGIMYRIDSVEKDVKKGTLTVSGRGLLSFFEGTAEGEERTVEGPAATLLLSLARRGVANMPLTLGLASVTDGSLVKVNFDRGSLIDHMAEVCRMGGVGMRLEHRDGKLLFTPLIPRDRTKNSSDPVKVSGEMGTFAAQQTVVDYSGYRNVAVVSGAEKEDGGRYTVTVRSDSIDVGDSFPDEDHFDRQLLVRFSVPVGDYMVEDPSLGKRVLDENAYKAAMRLSGAAALGRCRPRIQLFGSIADATGLLVGDKVTVSDEISGFSGDALVSRMVTEYTGKGKHTSAELVAKIKPE